MRILPRDARGRRRGGAPRPCSRQPGGSDGMATLEVHDGPGRVRRVTISRDQTVLFGSSPKCDIVLEGPGVLPFHGRLRWKETRFKVDASPDARHLEINGKRLAASSFRQGDEITIGTCRIFMIHADEDLP